MMDTDYNREVYCFILSQIHHISFIFKNRKITYPIHLSEKVYIDMNLSIENNRIPNKTTYQPETSNYLPIFPRLFKDNNNKHQIQTK